MSSAHNQILIPFREFSENHRKYFERIADIFSRIAEKEIKILSPSRGIPFCYQVEKLQPSGTIVTPIESLYLSAKSVYKTVFILSFTNLRGVIISSSSNLNTLKKLKGKKIHIPLHAEWISCNPVLQFCYRHCEMSELSERNPFFLGDGVKALHEIIDGNLDAVITTTFELNRLRKKLNSEVYVIGEFPFFPELALLVHSDYHKNISKFVKLAENWIKSEPEIHRVNEFTLVPATENSYKLLEEAIGLLDFTPQMYIEDKVPIPEIRHLKDDRTEGEKILSMKSRLKDLELFNEKLLKAYSEIKASKESLHVKLEKKNQNYILFDREGIISGISRGITELLGYTRSQVVNKSIYDFINMGEQKLFSKMITHVEVGLIKSFEVSIKNIKGELKKIKMNCTVVELSDSKVILANMTI